MNLSIRPGRQPFWAETRNPGDFSIMAEISVKMRVSVASWPGGEKRSFQRTSEEIARHPGWWVGGGNASSGERRFAEEKV